MVVGRTTVVIEDRAAVAEMTVVVFPDIGPESDTRLLGT